MDTTSTSLTDRMQRTRWYIRLRWILLLLIIIPALLAVYIGEGWSTRAQHDTILAALAIISNCIFSLAGRIRQGSLLHSRLGVTLIAFDVLLITFFIYNKGGIESRSLLLYTIPILMSAAIFGRLAVYLTALTSALLYDLLIVANYFGIFSSLDTYTSQSGDFAYVLNSIIFFSVVLAIIGFLADYITTLLTTKERQATDTALALRRAQQIAKLGSWQWDLVHDRVWWSEELHRIYGVKHRDGAEATYEMFLRNIHPDDRKMVDKTIQRAVKSGRSFTFDHRIVRRDGSIRYVHCDGQVIKDKQGKPLRLFGTAHDVTSERVLEKAKGDFVSLASHQLRTPATGVKVLLGLLQEGYVGTLTKAQNDLIQQAYEANERQLRIANDLLNIARLESGRLHLRKKQLDICVWLADVLEERKPILVRHNQVFVLNIPDKPVIATFDPDRLYMVVDNLISNASNYTKTGGQIQITLSATRQTIRIAVTDNGIGIARRDLSKLFQKFTRIDNRLSSEVEGTGLGLYLAKSIMDLHKGTIRVRSKPEVGTTFTLCLPRVAAATTSEIAKRRPKVGRRV